MRFWSQPTLSVTNSQLQTEKNTDKSQTRFVFFSVALPTRPRWWGCSHISLFLSFICIFRHLKNVGGKFSQWQLVCMWTEFPPQYHWHHVLGLGLTEIFCFFNKKVRTVSQIILENKSYSKFINFIPVLFENCNFIYIYTCLCEKKQKAETDFQFALESKPQGQSCTSKTPPLCHLKQGETNKHTPVQCGPQQWPEKITQTHKDRE